MMNILVSGSLAYDRIMDFPGRFEDHILPEKIHILNVCFTVNGLTEKFGGTAGNIAYNLSLLGEKPRILAASGKDFDRYQRWLDQLGLPTDGIRHIEDEFTASAYITTDMGDNQITGFNPGAMKYPSNFEADGLSPDHTLAIIAPGNIEDMVRYCRMSAHKRFRYICDPGQSITALGGSDLEEMITGSSVLISNDYELELIVKRTGLNVAQLLQRTGAIITTLGEKGSQVLKDDTTVALPAVAVDSVTDPTGAGDAYRAGLIKGLVSGKNLTVAASMGATCASFAVEHVGTQEHRFSMEAFWQRFEAAFTGRGTSHCESSP
jgi:adenosine kinase